MHTLETSQCADRNLRCFTIFRAFFSARFYYPVYALLFLDFGLTLEQFGILNAVWALTIVLSEVPSGALADTIGRRKLLITAGICMAAEMAVLLLATPGAGTLVFYLFLVNRIISGLAEAAASGADEALAYDSLKAAGRELEWGRILEQVQRMTSVAFFFAMTLGAVVYDPSFVNAALNTIGLDAQFSQSQLVKLPIFLTFLSSIVVLFSAWRMHEIKQPKKDLRETLGKSGRQILAAGRWITITPLAFGVVLCLMALDSVIRQYLTLASEYWKTIELPIASFGLIGSGTAILGIFTPRVARILADRYSPIFNLWITSALVLLGLCGLALVIPIWGIAPAVLLHLAMQLMNYHSSRYLNEIAPSEQRATVLSFKGLSTNLTYGITALLYSGLIALIKVKQETDPSAINSATEATVFTESLIWFPVYFIAALGLALALHRLRFRNKTFH
ncbi:MAG: MFS transporter [Verrucomicrobia bacterium]|nr:MFS transporter [Verrucomicrobiota bacterium]